jgi:zinc transport system substrate-binding protein
MRNPAPAFVVLSMLFAPCSLRAGAETPAGAPRFVTTIPPMADVLSRIAGERAEVSWLLPAGASPHTHEPRPSDVRKTESALALFYVDERLDGWAARLPAPKRIRILSLVPDSLLLEFPGEDAAHGHGIGIDPHFWTDPATVRAAVPALAAELARLDPDGAPLYERNAAALSARLDSLDRAIAERIAPARGKAVILTHPFLCYYLHRYGIPLAATIEVIEGKEPTAKDIARVVEAAGANRAVLILASPELSRRAADLIAESTGLRVRMVDPLGGVRGLETLDDILLRITDGIVEEAR